MLPAPLETLAKAVHPAETGQTLSVRTSFLARGTWRPQIILDES